MFSELVKQLPEADIPGSGITGYMLKGEHGLVVFFEFTEDAVVPAHHHGAQWGTVVSGQVKLTLNGELHVYGPGDSYAIKAGEVHSAELTAGTQAIDLFEDVDRYDPRDVG